MSDYQYEQARDDQRRLDEQRENTRIFDQVTQRQLDDARSARERDDALSGGSTVRGTLPSFPVVYPGGRPSRSTWRRENRPLTRDITKTMKDLRALASGTSPPSWWKRNHVTGWLAAAAAAIVAVAALAEDQKQREAEATSGQAAYDESDHDETEYVRTRAIAAEHESRLAAEWEYGKAYAAAEDEASPLPAPPLSSGDVPPAS
ncbi:MULTISPECIES: hypothetical protein [unclassified Frankia]|uniref:hypothetical protein n=1 Tax=unclassified Frankia TaxID=2632575 RepID=UPI002024D8CE